jgi:hypothetical protein
MPTFSACGMPMPLNGLTRIQNYPNAFFLPSIDPIRNDILLLVVGAVEAVDILDSALDPPPKSSRSRPARSREGDVRGTIELPLVLKLLD